MEAFIPQIISIVSTGLISAFGCYVAMTNRLTKLETKIDNLEKKQDKHNEVIERTYKLEAQVEDIQHAMNR